MSAISGNICQRQADTVSIEKSHGHPWDSPLNPLARPYILTFPTPESMGNDHSHTLCASHRRQTITRTLFTRVTVIDEMPQQILLHLLCNFFSKVLFLCLKALACIKTNELLHFHFSANFLGNLLQVLSNG